jgi:hypothetical protein
MPMHQTLCAQGNRRSGGFLAKAMVKQRSQPRNGADVLPKRGGQSLAIDCNAPIMA